MQQTKKVVLFGLWFLGFTLIMRHIVAPMSGQDPVVVEASPAPVLGAATVATQSPNQQNVGHNMVLGGAAASATSRPQASPSSAPRPSATPATSNQNPTATASPSPSTAATPSPSATPTTSPTPSPAPTSSPLFPTLPHIHLP